MQQWFETPAFLVEMFRKVNPGVELVPSDPIMDPLRGVKEPAEISTMTAAQRIAGIGMDRARSMLRQGALSHEIATEAMYAMMRTGASRTSTPIYVNVGRETCMLHGWHSPRPVQAGDLVVIDLTPVVDGYCANLARTFVLGEPDAAERASPRPRQPRSAPPAVMPETGRARRGVSRTRRCPMVTRARISRFLPFAIALLPFILAACGPGGTTSY